MNLYKAILIGLLFAWLYGIHLLTRACIAVSAILHVVCARTHVGATYPYVVCLYLLWLVTPQIPDMQFSYTTGVPAYLEMLIGPNKRAPWQSLHCRASIIYMNVHNKIVYEVTCHLWSTALRSKNDSHYWGHCSTCNMLSGRHTNARCGSVARSQRRYTTCATWGTTDSYS